MHMKMLDDPSTTPLLWADTDSDLHPNLISLQFYEELQSSFRLKDLEEFHVLWARSADWHLSADAVSVAYRTFAAFKADPQHREDKGWLFPILCTDVYRTPTKLGTFRST